MPRADAVILEANVPNTITRTYFEQCNSKGSPVLTDMMRMMIRLD